MLKVEGNMVNKVAVITGGGNGIGAAAADELSEKGVKVALLDIREDRLNNKVEELKAKGRIVHGVVCDVAEREQVFDAIQQVREKLGTIDILLANAGISGLSMMEKISVDKWLKVVDVNIIGVLNCLAASLPDMMEKKSGHVVFTSSVGGRQGIAMVAPYCGTKFFIQGFAAGIRQELAPHGIKVTCIQPAFTNTDIYATSDPEVMALQGDLDAMRPIIIQPQDVAKTFSFVLNQPDRVGVNEILIETTSLPSSLV